MNSEIMRALCERHGLGSEANVKEQVKMAFGKMFIQRRAPKGMSTDRLVKALMIASTYLEKDDLGSIIEWAYGSDSDTLDGKE